MLKIKYFIIIFLTISIVILFIIHINYKNIDNYYEYKTISPSFPILLKEINIERDENINIKDYIYFYNAEKANISSKIDNQELIINLDNKEYRYPIKYKKEKVKEVIKTGFIRNDILYISIKGYKNNEIENNYNIELSKEDDIDIFITKLLNEINNNIDLAIVLNNLILNKEGNITFNGEFEGKEVIINVTIK